MPSPLEQPLHLLIPTAPSLPPQLLAAAESLLAQSKAKAPRLKPDEEIARAFACCHIACERLKNRFGLEIGKVGPPCGPRVYKKLYAFLEGVLPAAPATPRAGRVKDVETPKKGVEGRSGGRAKLTPGSRVVGSSLGKRGRGAAVSKPGEEEEMPRYAMPLIRHLSAIFSTPEAPTHVYAGVESVYRHLQTQQEDAEPQTPSKRRKTGGAGAVDAERGKSLLPIGEQFPAFVAAIYIQTVLAMYGRDMTSGSVEVATATQNYFAKSTKAISNLTIDPEQLTSDISTYIIECQTAGWTSMEWHSNLPSSDSLVNEEDADLATTLQKRPAKTPLRRKEKHASRPGESEEVRSAAGLLPGLGSMFQPAVDWLSDERRAGFQAWREEVLAG